MRTILTIGIIVLAGALTHAQKNELTLEDAVLKRFSHYYPKGPSQLQWIPNTDDFSYVTDDEVPVLKRQGPNEIEASSVVDLSRLSAALELEEPLKAFSAHILG